MSRSRRSSRPTALCAIRRCHSTSDRHDRTTASSRWCTSPWCCMHFDYVFSRGFHTESARRVPTTFPSTYDGATRRPTQSSRAEASHRWFTAPWCCMHFDYLFARGWHIASAAVRLPYRRVRGATHGGTLLCRIHRAAQHVAPIVYDPLAVVLHAGRSRP
jgi:hypothetical protein